MKRILLLLVLSLFFVPTVFGAEQIIANSQDWRDVYSVMLFGSLTDTPASFLVSERHSNLILNSIINPLSDRLKKL